MTSWRSVQGYIDILDPDLTTPEKVAEFFASQQILGRGRHVAHGYEFEVAISGRRRRVAMLDDAGTVIRGLTVSDLLVEMQDKLRKVAVELDGEVVHGPLDIGAVDIDDDVDDDVDLAQPLPVTGEEDFDQGISGAQIPDFSAGPMMLMTDMSMAEVPSMANTQQAPIVVSKLGNMRVLVSEESLGSYRKVFPRPNYVMALAPNVANQPNPVLMVRRDNTRLVWDWAGEMPVFGWIAEGSVAHEFVCDELGAGAIARLAIADLVNVTFAEMRHALLVEPQAAVRTLIRTLGLPSEIADVLAGKGALSAIPATKLVSPDDWSFEDMLAWEFAGEGVLEPSMMRAVNKIYIDRPWLVAIGSAAQATLAGALLATALHRHRQGAGGKTLFVVGTGVLLSAFTRIGTTTYMRSIVDRKQKDIETWRNIRNWQA
ncbi:sulfur carrier protein ThiS [Arcanobacterium buesumense]|uniref:Sulfur carrier protein ThiS n=1 Tax=Arcanobacterium buesumense TaxID=2722751 RepID=A0A6H2EN28_9ACTO|nr:sulfur carrier protein ThiS [Arcanobacterium buesumense]QJC22480.1 sulfur carrier protein ThiS [Arcanobacterium buesumense]